MGETIKETKVAVLKNYDIAAPDQMSKMAVVLHQHINDHGLYTKIVGKDYAHVEGWQFAGGLMGLYPRVKEVTNLSTGTEKKWQATVEIVRMKDNQVMSVGVAICSNAETKKKSFDEYAVLSMAQTRAIGKAYRNLIGWVMKLAGMESTPAEEMTNTKPADSATYEKALKIITAEKDVTKLENMKKKISTSKLYNKDQKDQLIGFIDAKINPEN